MSFVCQVTYCSRWRLVTKQEPIVVLIKMQYIRAHVSRNISFENCSNVIKINLNKHLEEASVKGL